VKEIERMNARIDALEQLADEVRPLITPAEGAATQKNPRPPPLTEAAKKARQRQAAARARGGKRLGNGKGCVRTKRTRDRLRKEAKDT
jgi:hypothetical protein